MLIFFRYVIVPEVQISSTSSENTVQMEKKHIEIQKIQSSKNIQETAILVNEF